MFDFPNSPTNGQVFAPASGPVYVYTGGVWRMQGSGQVVTAEARNRIVNGAMQISQENGNTPSATNSATSGWYNADQWSSNWSLSPGTAVASRNSAAPFLSDNSNYLTLGIGTAKAALAASDNLHIGTQIEGVRMRDFLWGTASAKQAVLVFSIYSNVTGTYTVAIRNGAADRSFLAPFAYSTAGAWQQFSIAVPGDTAGTWVVDTSRGAYINFSFAMGSNFNGVAGWQAGSLMQLPGSSNLAATAANGLRLGNVGLYLDPNATGVPPPWQMPDEAQELAACQRYWWKMDTTTTPFMYTSYNDMTVRRFTHFFSTTMRVVPTLSGTISAGTLASAVGTTQYSAWAVTAVGVAGQVTLNTHSANARM